MATVAGVTTGAGQPHTLQRRIDWTGAFWVASGVPALVLFSIGGIAATVGSPSWVVWTISVLFGFLQAFTYAEIAGLFPDKSGGASVYGAAAWIRYSKYIAPISVWANWLAWSPVLAIGSGLAAGYILTALLPADSVIRTWEITLLNLDGLKEGLRIRINSTFIVGAGILLLVFLAQHHGILRAARITTVVGIAVLVPLLIVGIVPIFNGQVSWDNFQPFAPLAYDAEGNIADKSQWVWDLNGWTLFLGGLFIAAWSAYAFETAICYTSEFINPKVDTFKAIFYSGLLCILVYTLVPFTFQGALGVEGMLAEGIVDGSAVGSTMAKIVGGSETGLVFGVMVFILILALILAIMTSMAGSSRTLYQGSVDGWLPKYLSHANQWGAPTRAMWTDLTFNLILLMMSDYLFVLAVSNSCYIVFNFLNLNAGWIHRVDSGHVARPWKAPNWLLGVGVLLSFVNMALLGAGANVWGPGTLMTALVFIAGIVPVFLYRHHVTDRGRFPEHMLDDLLIHSEAEYRATKAGILPYVTLAVGVAVAITANQIFSP
ncbi:MAG: APC family permease [Chromatiales bacterium]